MNMKIFFIMCFQFGLVDINGDGDVTLVDVVKIQRMVIS